MLHRWIATFVGVFAIATAWSAAQAVDPPADANRVLREAELKLKGNSYILVAETEAELIARDLRDSGQAE